jgi:hypothetical protein
MDSQQSLSTLGDPSHDTSMLKRKRVPEGEQNTENIILIYRRLIFELKKVHGIEFPQSKEPTSFLKFIFEKGYLTLTLKCFDWDYLKMSIMIGGEPPQEMRNSLCIAGLEGLFEGNIMGGHLCYEGDLLKPNIVDTIAGDYFLILRSVPNPILCNDTCQS